MATHSDRFWENLKLGIKIMTFDLDLWVKVVTFDLDLVGVKVVTFDLGGSRS